MRYAHLEERDHGPKLQTFSHDNHRPNRTEQKSARGAGLRNSSQSFYGSWSSPHP